MARVNGRNTHRYAKFTDELKEKFWELLRQGWSSTYAAKKLNISMTPLYIRRKVDAAFNEEWEAAYEAGTDVLEDEARRRAHDGVEEPVFYQGDECGRVRKYSDVLLMFLLNGRRPEKYKNRTELTGKNGGPLVVASKLDEQL